MKIVVVVVVSEGPIPLPKRQVVLDSVLHNRVRKQSPVLLIVELLRELALSVARLFVCLFVEIVNPPHLVRAADCIADEVVAHTARILQFRVLNLLLMLQPVLNRKLLRVCVLRVSPFPLLYSLLLLNLYLFLYMLLVLVLLLRGKLRFALSLLQVADNLFLLLRV